MPLQTGPNTDEGKARSGHNAEKHGIFATNPVLDHEDPAEWEAHLCGMIESLQPEGDLETGLARRIATVLWRLARVLRYETEMISVGAEYEPDHETVEPANAASAKQAATPPPNPDRDRRKFIAARLIPGDMTGPTIIRYEATLNRAYIQTLHELVAIQTRRKGGASQLSRIGITAPRHLPVSDA